MYTFVLNLAKAVLYNALDIKHDPSDIDIVTVSTNYRIRLQYVVTQDHDGDFDRGALEGHNQIAAELAQLVQDTEVFAMIVI